MTMAWPMTKAAASEHSQTTAAAISSGLPIRPTGSSAITFARPSAVPPVKRPIIGVLLLHAFVDVDEVLRTGRTLEFRRPLLPLGVEADFQRVPVELIDAQHDRPL